MQVLLRCFNLRRSLLQLGGDGGDGSCLVELLAGAGEDGAAELALLETLSPPMLAAALGAEADTAVAVMYREQQLQR